jgi:hypothetical protein
VWFSDDLEWDHLSAWVYLALLAAITIGGRYGWVAGRDAGQALARGSDGLSPRGDLSGRRAPSPSTAMRVSRHTNPVASATNRDC